MVAVAATFAAATASFYLVERPIRTARGWRVPWRRRQVRLGILRRPLIVLGLAIEAVNLGYRVAVVTDAVAGVPREYGRAVIDNTIALLATRVAVDDVIASWKV